MILWNLYLCRFLLDTTTSAEIMNDIQTMRTLEKQSYGLERRQDLARMISLYENRLAEIETQGAEYEFSRSSCRV
ncbi:MAG: hypothetical protein LUD14_09010 [Clostridiales bacterium]|nr:hypothetical protein [Clostridiales bacterium]